MSGNGAQGETIRTRIPSRLDRLGSIGDRLTESGSGISLDALFGPGQLSSARAMSASGPHPEVPLDREIQIIGRALEDRGSANRRKLARRVGARYWGPGRFRKALLEAVAEGAVKRLRGGECAPARGPGGHERDPSHQPVGR
jgi:hypothetical protein